MCVYEREKENPRERKLVTRGGLENGEILHIYLFVHSGIKEPFFQLAGDLPLGRSQVVKSIA